MTTRPDLVVIPCGGKKRDGTHPAHRLYTGSYFTACYRAALALDPVDGIVILSAKHGFLRPRDVIDSYDLRMGQPGSVTAATLIDQAADMGIADHRFVTVLAGGDYTAQARRVWPHADAPLVGVGGMGHQLHVLAAITAQQGALFT